MDKAIANRRPSHSRTSVTHLLAILLVVCLVECATEERINDRGSKLSDLVEKVNGWRSQRGDTYGIGHRDHRLIYLVGSCLSYGHSCWGAHGKRSGKPPATAPDWFVTRMLRRMAANAEEDDARRQATGNSDITAIYRVDLADDAGTSNKMATRNNEESPLDLGARRNSEAIQAIPMLDEELIPKMKMWQMMRQQRDVNK